MITPTRTAPPYGGDEILAAALAQARVEFARGGDLRALELAWRIERRAFPRPAYRPGDGETFVIPGGRK